MKHVITRKVTLLKVLNILTMKRIGRRGAVLYGSEEDKVYRYSWGFSHMRNKQVEIYGLYQELLLDKEHYKDTLMVMRDSFLVLHHLVKGSLLKEKATEKMMKIIKKNEEYIPSKIYLHVL